MTSDGAYLFQPLLDGIHYVGQRHVHPSKSQNDGHKLHYEGRKCTGSYATIEKKTQMTQYWQVFQQRAQAVTFRQGLSGVSATSQQSQCCFNVRQTSKTVAQQ